MFNRPITIHELGGMFMPEGCEFLWRCRARRFSVVIDAECEHYGVSAPRLEAWKYEIVKRTPKGAWIQDGVDRRWVNLTARKQYASETKIEALRQFYHRKSRHKKILESQLSDVEQQFELAGKALEQMEMER